MSAPSAESIALAIKAAFADVNADGVETVADLLNADDWFSESVDKDFRGRWQDLPVEWIEKYDSLYNFANHVSLRYYAPAVMCWTLRERRLMQSSEAFIGTLYGRGKEYRAGKQPGSSFVRGLKPLQIRAIVCFLEWASWLSVAYTKYSDCGHAYAVWQSIEGECVH